MATKLIIYDNTGRIWGMFDDETTVPSGLQGMIVTVPDGYFFTHLDMSTTPPTPVFEKEYDPDALEAQIYYTAVMTDTLIEEEE